MLKSDRWDTTIATGVLGNLRQTPQNGFCGSSYNLAECVAANTCMSVTPHASTHRTDCCGSSLVDSTTFSPESGWRSRYDSEGGSPNFSPHYESYIWAAYLWAYSRSGFQPLLDRAQTGLRLMMENYPTKWIPTANGIAMQRARILLPLAFLVRANDTALHRQWLQTAIDGMSNLGVTVLTFTRTNVGVDSNLVGFLTRQHCENDWCIICMFSYRFFRLVITGPVVNLQVRVPRGGIVSRVGWQYPCPKQR